MSGIGMTRTLLATQLQDAIAKDAAAGKIGLVAKEFGPNVQAWLKEVADVVASPEPETPAGESADNAKKLAEGIAAAAQKVGIYNGQAALSGPMLLQLLDNMVQACNRTPKERVDLEAQLDSHYQLALKSTMPPIAQAQMPRWWFSLGFRASAQDREENDLDGTPYTTAERALEAGDQVTQHADDVLAALLNEATALEASLENPTQEKRDALRQATQARSKLVALLRTDIDMFRTRRAQATEAAAAARAMLLPWRQATEHDVSRLEGKKVLTPDGEKKARFVSAEGIVLCTDCSSYPLQQLQVRHELVIYLDELNWKSVLDAAMRSKWMPPEYMVNDWLADVCNWLENGPREDIERVLDEVAQQWDGCKHDSPGIEIDIGEAIRTAGQRLLDGKVRQDQPVGQPSQVSERERQS